MGQSLILRSDEASKGGFNAIKLIEGVIMEPKRVPPPPNASTEYGEPKDRVELHLEDAIILEMEAGEEEPPLKDGGYTWWINYAAKEKEKASDRTFFVKGVLKSAERLAEERGIKGGSIADLVGTRVTMKKAAIELFKRPVVDEKTKQPVLDEEGKKKYDVFEQTNLVFASDSEAGTSSVSGSLDDQAKAIILGKSKIMAKRDLLLNPKTKAKPQYKQAIDDGSIDEMLGVKLVEGVYVDATEESGS